MVDTWRWLSHPLSDGGLRKQKTREESVWYIFVTAAYGDIMAAVQCSITSDNNFKLAEWKRRRLERRRIIIRFRIDSSVHCVGGHPSFWHFEPARLKPN